MPAALIIGGLAAAGAIGGAVITSHATSKAAQAATNAANQNNQLQGQIYDSNKGILQPYSDRGNAAGDRYNALLGINSPANDRGQAPAGSLSTDQAYNDFLNSDGYQFRVNEGEKALNTGYAAKGLLQSGAALKGINSFAQGTASDEFGKYMGYLGNQQATGLAAGSSLAGTGQNYANAVSANNNSAASAVGNAALAGANSTNNAISNAVNAFGIYQGMASSYGDGGSGSRNAYGVKSATGNIY